MNHQTYVRRTLERLRDRHGFTEDQLRAIAPYVALASKNQLDELRDGPSAAHDRQYALLYSPRPTSASGKSPAERRITHHPDGGCTVHDPMGDLYIDKYGNS